MTIPRSVDRRLLLRSAAWGAPAVAVASAAPAFATSGETWEIVANYTSNTLRSLVTQTGWEGYEADTAVATGFPLLTYSVLHNGSVVSAGQMTLSLQNQSAQSMPGLAEFFDPSTMFPLGTTVQQSVIAGVVQCPSFDYSAVYGRDTYLVASFTPPSGTCPPLRMLLPRLA